MTNEDGTAKYPGGLKDYIINHQRRPGVGMLAGWRGNGDKSGKGEPNANQLERYIENGCHWRTEIPDNAKFFRHANANYFDWAIALGLKDLRDQIVLQIYSEPLRKFQLAGEGFGAKLPPEAARARLRERFRSAAGMASAVRRGGRSDRLSAARDHPAADAHVPFLGIAECLVAADPGAQCAVRQSRDGRDARPGRRDWVWIESPHGRVKAPVQLMEGVNRDTVWTWNAIGKRTGAWNLAADAPESQKGFLA